MKKTVFDTH